MSDKDILSNYGKDSSQPQKPRAYCGGVEAKDVKDINYSTPQGPTNQMRRAVGLGGTNHGCCGTQGKH